jgi:CheY-like chemotaxis protein
VDVEKLLVIDDNADGLCLLVRTLLRKFPESVVLECRDAAAAIETARGDDIDIIIAHRTTEADCGELVRMLRTVKPDVPIVLVCSTDGSELARSVGATCFVHYDAWLTLGTVVEQLISERSAETSPASS